MKKFSKIIIAALLGIFLIAGSSWAIPTMQISGTGFTTFQIDDSDNGEVDGLLSYTGLNIGAFDITMTGGTTMPQIGSSSDPKMHLNVFADTKNTEGTITIEFSEIGFGNLNNNITGFLSEMGGLGGIEQSLDVYYDTNNTLFSQRTQIADLDAIGETIFYNSIPADSPFSLTMVATIRLAANSSASLDDGVSTPVPEPGTMLLLGSGLLGMAVVSRKKIFKS